MNSVEISFATAQVILNILHGNKTLEIYEDPLGKIVDLCETTKKVIQKNNKGELTKEGLPLDLPFEIFQKEPQLFSSLGQDIYSKTVEGSWMKKEKVLTSQNKKDMIQKIYKKYSSRNSDEKRGEYVLKELMEAPSSFLEELYQIENSKDLQEKIDNWSSYELEDVFDRIHASSGKEEKKIEIDETLEDFIKNQFIPSDKDQIKNLRDTFAESILFNFKNVYDLTHEKFTLNTYFKTKKIDNAYNGTFPPSFNYVRNIFLPWLLLFKTGSVRNEKMVYMEFNKDYKKVSKT